MAERISRKTRETLFDSCKTMAESRWVTKEDFRTFIRSLAKLTGERFIGPDPYAMRADYGKAEVERWTGRFASNGKQVEVLSQEPTIGQRRRLAVSEWSITVNHDEGQVAKEIVTLSSSLGEYPVYHVAFREGLLYPTIRTLRDEIRSFTWVENALGSACRNVWSLYLNSQEQTTAVSHSPRTIS